MGSFAKGIVIFFLIFLVITVLSVGMGWVGGKGTNFLKRTIEKESIAIDHEIFKESSQYIEGAVRDLSRMRFEYNTEEESVAKKVILERVRTSYANFDVKSIEDEDLATWFKSVRAGTIK